MLYISHYPSPIGDFLLTADADGLTGIWFDSHKYDAVAHEPVREERDSPLFEQTKRWLSIYFAGQEPDFIPPLHLTGSSFQLSVWEILLQIPYGKTMTYGEIARRIAAQRNLLRMSAQAVGGAVGRNPISIIVPCHRVIGTDGSLTGYGGGLDKKVALLTLEKANFQTSPLLLQ